MDPTMMFSDSLRFLHVVAVSFGVGTVLVTEYFVISNIRYPVNALFLDRLGSYHRMIACAIVGMWVTGLALVYLRTGFQPANFSPKIIAKIVVVLILTLNAVLIDRLLLPRLHHSLGRKIPVAPMRECMTMAAIAGVSSASWLSALVLGISKSLLMAKPVVLLPLFVTIYLATTAGAILSFVFLRWRCKREVSRAIQSIPPPDDETNQLWTTGSPA